MSLPLKSLLFALACCGLALLFGSPPTSAAINPQINFQGKLTNTDGTNVADGNYSMRFRIYTDPSADTGTCANTCKWEETQATVAVSAGLFQVNLGSVTALPGSVDFNSSPLYLGTKVGADSEMTPRVRLTAVPQAFNSDLLDGLDSTNFVQLSGGNVTLGSGTLTSGAINGVTIGSTIQPSAAGALTVRSNGANALNLTGGAASTWDIGSSTLSVQTTNNGAITLGSGLLTLGGNATFAGTTARTITGPSTGGLSVTVASGPLSLSTTTAGTLTASSAGALTLTGGAASTWSTTGGGLTIQASGTNTLTLNTGGAGTVDLGGTNTTTINIGGTSGSTTNIAVGNVAHTVHIADGGSSTNQVITIGSTNSGSTTTLQGNTVAILSGSNITLGTVDATGTLLVLDTKNTTGDPTEVDGGLYYNSANNRFRCGQNGTWINCISGTMATNTAASAAVNTCTTACTSFSTNAALPANYCVPGRVLHVVANGVYSTTASTTLSMGVYVGTNSTTKTSDTLIGAASGALSSGAAVTNVGWGLDFYISCFTAGAAGTVSGQGNFSMGTSATATAAGGKMYSSATTTVNTTAAQTIYLFPAFGASAAGNTATVQQFVVTTL